MTEYIIIAQFKDDAIHDNFVKTHTRVKISVAEGDGFQARIGMIYFI